MTTKKNPSFTKLILELVSVIPNLITFASNISSLINLESRLAGKSFFQIVALSVVFACLLTTSWLCLLGMLLFYFISLQVNLIAAIAIVFLINSLLLIIVGLVLSKSKKDLLFTGTRQRCVAAYKKHRGNEG